MKSLSAVATVLAALLFLSAVPSAFANDMNAILIPETNKGEAHYIGVKNLSLRYPAGSGVASAFGNSDTRITHTISGDTNSTDKGVISAITAFNRAMLDIGSPTQVTSMRLIYTAAVKPTETSTLISLKIEAIPTIERFVLGDSTNEAGASHIVDMEWRGILVREPIVVNVPQYGEMDINRGIGLLQKLNPELAEQVESSQAREIFEEPILDFRKFDQKMDSWHFLFDPSGSLVETSAFFREESGAKVVSIYSLGESSFREGTFEAEEKDASANIGGTNVAVHSQVPAPSGQIQLSGFSNVDVSQADAEFANVSIEAPAGFTTATGGFPIQVLLILGGMMGAIAVFILWKARK